MATNENSWTEDIINDFIHSSIWLSPIQTFIDTNCACFDYDDHENESSIDEQKNIHKRYYDLVDSLINSLSEDLGLNKNELTEFYQRNNSIATDESYEQLFSTTDFDLFKEMMKRKNLILQLQALVNLQLECGLLKQTDTKDDQVLQLLLRATSTSSTVETSRKNLPQVLPDLKQKGRSEANTDWHKQLQSKETKTNTEPKTIDSVPEEILREKLRELSISTTTSTNDETASAISSRKNFLQQQRDLIIKKQRDERVRDLEKETINARPQSAVNIARKSMGTTNKQEQPLSNDELEKRRAMADKLRREVVDKR